MTPLRNLHARLDALSQRPETWWDVAGGVVLLAVTVSAVVWVMWVVSA